MGWQRSRQGWLILFIILGICVGGVKAGDAIVIGGQKHAIGTPVVLWTDPGGFNAYKSFSDGKKAVEPGKGKKVFGVRNAGEELKALKDSVDQFVIHYDVCGISKTCFKVLNDRGLSVHFMLDLDGTIYQSLDLKERAYHATVANHRSIGVEIANMGSYAADIPAPRLDEWYRKQPNGEVLITIPKRFGDPQFRRPHFVPKPRTPAPVVGMVQGKRQQMYDLTQEQYDALIKLTAGLCRAFPKITCDYPKDADGKLIPRKLDDAHFVRYQGILGHYHVQLNKTDPGPAFDWNHVIHNARRELNGK